MGVDYYKILQVGRGAKDDDLSKSFKRFSEAYDVLSDPAKRAIYDQYGEEGLKGQVPPPGAGGAGRQTTWNTNDVFASFFGSSSSPFGSSSPSESMGGGGGGAGGMRGGRSRTADDLFTEFFGSSSPSGSMEGGGGGGAGDMRGGRISGLLGEDIFESSGGREGIEGTGGQMKEAAIERRLPFSLEELYKGTTKKMKISREISDARGKTMPVEEILTIEIKPGWKKGTKITFPKKGNEQPNVMPADLVFIVDEKPHSVFTRDGNDLTVTQKISLAEALTCYTVSVTTLDGRTLTLPINSIIHPEYEEVVIPKEGMPLPKDPSRKGNLRIKFNIKFPTWLSSEQKAGIKMLLAP